MQTILTRFSWLRGRDSRLAGGIFGGFLLVFPLVFLSAACVFAQGDPIELLDVDTVKTRNFEIVMERSTEHPRPTAQEVGILVERLCGQLDKIFSRYAPQRVADEEERRKKEETEEKKPTNPARPSSRTADEADPNRVIPKCRIFIFNGRPQLEAKCMFDGIRPLAEGYAGFFTLQTNSIYMIRSWSLKSTREIILHEATHYYTENFLPGGGRCYPLWFCEGLSESYENHFWNGNKLVIGVTPRIQKFDSPASALTGLVRFREYQRERLRKSSKEGGSKEDDSKNRPNFSAPTSESEPPAESATDTPTPPDRPARKLSKSKERAPPETPIDPGLIQPFLDTQFTPEIFASEGIKLDKPDDVIAHRYAMYQALGRFLLYERPDHLSGILRQVALWEKEQDKTFRRNRWFVEAWKKVAAEKPISVEEMGRWLQKNQLPFKWSFGDWQDLGESVAGKAQPGMVCLLALSNPQSLPQFTALPKRSPMFQIGVAINFIDEDNYGVVAVDQDGDVLVMEQQNGSWNGPARKIGSVRPDSVRDHPYNGSPAFHFRLKRQGNMIGVQINGTAFGVYPTSLKGSCGFFLSSTEGVFSY